jgi:hypothetical protein
VLGGANWGDVVAAIGVTIRQAKGMRGQAMITAYNSSSSLSFTLTYLIVPEET